MKKTIYKFFLAYEFEKEEKWLNEMSAKGLHLDGVGFCKYIFKEGTPGEYTYHLELLDNMPSTPESEQYIHFLEDTGVEHVGSVIRWAYFRKKAADGEFTLFSDIDSRVKHLKRLTSLFAIVGIFEYVISFSNFMTYYEQGQRVSLFSALLTTAFGLVLTYAFLRIYRQIRRLKKERLIRE